MPIPTGLDPRAAHDIGHWKTGRPIVCCRIEPRGRFVFVGDESSTVKRVSLADGKKTEFAGAHDSWVFSLAFSPGGETAFSGGGDGRVVAWETGSAESNPRPKRTIEAHKGWVRALGASPDGALVASGGNDRAVRLWDAGSGRLVRELTGHLNHVYSLEFTPDGKTLLSGDLLGSIRHWDVASGSLLGVYEARPLHHHDKGQMVDFGGVRALAVSADAGTIAAGGLHKATNPLGAVHEPLVLVFDARTRKITRTLLAEGIVSGVIWRLRYLADGTLMGVSGANSGGHLLFWRAGSDKDFHRITLPGSARDMDLHPDGLRVVTGQPGGTIHIIRLAAGKG